MFSCQLSVVGVQCEPLPVPFGNSLYSQTAVPDLFVRLKLAFSSGSMGLGTDRKMQVYRQIEKGGFRDGSWKAGNIGNFGNFGNFGNLGNFMNFGNFGNFRNF